MQKLVQGIHRFQKDCFSKRPELFERLAHGQDPHSLFITCSDSRVSPELITQSDPGDLFVLRNAGNLVPSFVPDNDTGEAATIEYAVSVLKVRDIIVCGHTKCGAMHAVLYQNDTDQLPSVRRWLGHASKTRDIIMECYEHLHLDPTALWKATVEENVLVQLNQVRSHPCVAARLAEGMLKLHGWVYKIETGQIFAYDPESGQFRELDRTLPDSDLPTTPSDRKIVEPATPIDVHLGTGV